MYNTIVFDLDGTLTDPGEGITKSVAYALSKFNIHVEDRTTLYKFIGPPLQESFEKYYGLTAETGELAVQYYRERYSVVGLYENYVYDGIAELLSKLKNMGKTVLLATSKPEKFAIEILKHFKIDGYFDYMAGASMDGTRLRKADVIAYALSSCGIEDTSKAVMVGDREHDIFGAREVGIDSVGVLYGYGCRNEFQKAGATYIAESVEDILSFL